MIGPEIQHGMEPLPRWRYTAGKLIFRMLGWDIVQPPPPDPRLVMMAYPHTSNWDTVLMLVAGSIYRVRIQFLIKKSLFWFPLGPILRSFGGIPIDRAGNLGLVEQAASRIRESRSMMLAIAPEGTRRKKPGWKSGFYWIAVEAGVPLVCGVLDYGKKQASFGPVIHVTGDIVADMEKIREGFGDARGAFPENQSPIRVKEEDAPEADAP